MSQTVDAIYENGVFRPIQAEAVALPSGQRVRISVEVEAEPAALRLAAHVYEGLSDADIDEIEQIALDRGRFFRFRNPP